MYRFLLPILLMINLSACGQMGNHNHKPATIMEYGKISNENVRASIEAWQKGDSKEWLSYFSKNATLLDDGHPRDFIKFSIEAIGKERFTSIDKVENSSMDIYGKFHSDTWGDFKTYFKFRIGKDGKFDQLQIGQANY